MFRVKRVPASPLCASAIFYVFFVCSTVILYATAYQLDDKNDTSPFFDDKEHCVGDRLEALEFGRLCSRRCRKDLPCENARKQCLCDGLCGMSCIKPDLLCPELPKINGGDYAPKLNVFNTRVVYRCDEGRFLFGSIERTCQGDEDWSGIPAECNVEPQCRDSIKVNHARNPKDGVYRLNDRVAYTCYPGYEPSGVPEAACKLISHNHTAWVWSSSVPFRCKPRSCGDPGQIENGKRHGDSFLVASSVLYTCDEGFEMVGQARRYCQSDNQWSGQAPQCEPITCNPTEHLENGKINYAYPLVYNSSVEYACDYGFKLIGPHRRRCGIERKLVGSVPVCVEIDCGELGPLHNGYIKGYSSRMGDRKEFVCMDGMLLSGAQTQTVCLETGEWSAQPPKCLAPCEVPRVRHATGTYAISLDALTRLHNDIDRDSNVNQSITLSVVSPAQTIGHGSVLQVVCEKDYEFDDPVINYKEDDIVRGPTCLNGSWSYEPVCKFASCHSPPPSPKNGRVRVASLAHEAVGHIVCIDGYRLTGANITRCLKGAWTPINSVCSEIYCGFPGVIEHGRVLLVGLTGMYDYKPYIRRISNNRQIAYECENGYRLNDGMPSGATCMDGQWRPDTLPTCLSE